MLGLTVSRHISSTDGETGAILREYLWLPAEGDAPEAANDNGGAAAATPLPLALVTGVNGSTPQLLLVHADHLRRPIRLTDMNRATVWQASYDPFGLPLAVTGTVEQNLRFPGQYFLLETGLAYNWHRFYDPATGRYTQPDPLRFVDGPSVYGYAGGSPLMRVDPEGLSSHYYPTPLYPGYGVGDSNCFLFGIWCADPSQTLACMAVPDEWPKTGACSCFGIAVL